jgi:phenylacetate-coenzyme A ligase PaaK-like adenylate-forming protein
LDGDGLDERLAALADHLPSDLARPCPQEPLLRAADALSARLREGEGRDPALVAALLQTLRQDPAIGEAEARAALATVAAHLRRDALEAKLRRELGSLEPHTPRRIAGDEDAFEAWAPLGLLVHVAPGNVPTVAPLSVIEGLLAGNLNVLKTSSGAPPFAQLLLSALMALDTESALAPFISVVSLSSRDVARLRSLLALADGVAAWGGDAAIAAIADLAPEGCRVVDWGHKISFTYLTAERLDDEAALEAIARDVCRLEQQACSSPQCLYVEVPHRDALFAFARRFADVLARVSDATPRAVGAEPGPQEWADITTARVLAELEAVHSDTTRVLAAPDRSWRVFAEDHPALRASPLFRTLWIKPLLPERIVGTLRPMRRWLQTAGLACPVDRLADLSMRLVAAGVSRVARVGEQLGGYVGAPHDGVYALTRYSRRVSLELPASMRGVSSFDELSAPASPLRPDTPIMSKAAFVALAAEPAKAQLYFRSGGSSGDPKMSVFSWEDYHAQMRAASDGLRAAGLDPGRDRAINLFFAGHLYGGFISFWSILEHLGATQLPMAGVDDLAEVAQAIVAQRIDTLLGMPFYLNRLFTEQASALRDYGGVKKIFFGGEHMSGALRRRLKDDFGVETIRAASYGSNDAGPLGYQCPHCEDATYHVLTQSQYLEILDVDEDRPAAEGTPGRLVFSSLRRGSLPVQRYEIGDLGRAVPGPCACGRSAPRFELLGRYGDLFRAPAFFNYSRFVRTLSEEAGYSGPVQLELSHDGTLNRIKVRLLAGAAPPAETARALLLAHDPDLHHFVEAGEPMTGLDVEHTTLEDFVALPVTGKLKPIVDRRTIA